MGLWKCLYDLSIGVFIMGWFPCCCGQCETCLRYYTDFTTGSITGIKPPGSTEALPTGWTLDVSAIESAGSVEVGNGFVNFYGTEYGAWITNCGESGINNIPTGNTGNVQIVADFMMVSPYAQWFGFNIHYDENKTRFYEFRKNEFRVCDAPNNGTIIGIQSYEIDNIFGKKILVSFCFDQTADNGRGATTIYARNPDSVGDHYLFYIDPWIVSGYESLSVDGGYVCADIGAGGSGEYLPPIPPFTSGSFIYDKLHGTLYDFAIYDTIHNDPNCCSCTGLISGIDSVPCNICPGVHTGYMNVEITGSFTNASFYPNACCSQINGLKFYDIPYYTSTEIYDNSLSFLVERNCIWKKTYNQPTPGFCPNTWHDSNRIEVVVHYQQKFIAGGFGDSPSDRIYINISFIGDYENSNPATSMGYILYYDIKPLYYWDVCNSGINNLFCTNSPSTSIPCGIDSSHTGILNYHHTIGFEGSF